jgi:hypothetical protein
MVAERHKGASMELINTADNTFEPIPELLFLDHPGFYYTASPAHRRVLPTPKIFRYLRQRPVTTPLAPENSILIGRDVKSSVVKRKLMIQV